MSVNCCTAFLAAHGALARDCWAFGDDRSDLPMLEFVGHTVIKLVRIRMGPLSLGNLEPGEFRFLTDQEANALRELVQQRVTSVEKGEEAMPGPKRLVRREGWARPVKAKKYIRKKARTA